MKQFLYCHDGKLGGRGGVEGGTGMRYIYMCECVYVCILHTVMVEPLLICTC